MKYIVFCYNTPTLCRAIRYVDTVWGKENTHLIYADLVSPMPEMIKNDYSVTVLNTDGLDRKRGFSLIFGSCDSANRLWHVVLDIVNSINDELSLVVFRDNAIQEATVITRIKRIKPSASIILIEEGAGIYATSGLAPRYKLIKTIIYRLYGIDSYSLSGSAQGMNKYIDRIICAHPESLTQKVSPNVKIEQIIPIFTQVLNEYIIRAHLGRATAEQLYNYVFLTQPISDFRRNYDELLASHQLLLPKVFEILSALGNTIIKLHPRENYDYTQFVGEHVAISSKEESVLPFECLMQYYGNPQMISMFSSTSMTIKSPKPSLYLYKIFSIPGVEGVLGKDLLDKNNIIACVTLDDLCANLVN